MAVGGHSWHLLLGLVWLCCVFVYVCVYISLFLSSWPYTPPLDSFALSTDTRILKVLYTKTKSFCQRSFSYAGSTQWNSLPCEIRHIQSTPSLKTALKTYPFKTYFNYFKHFPSILFSCGCLSPPPFWCVICCIHLHFCISVCPFPARNSPPMLLKM